MSDHICDICGAIKYQETCDVCLDSSGFAPEENIELDVFELIGGHDD